MHSLSKQLQINQLGEILTFTSQSLLKDKPEAFYGTEEEQQLGAASKSKSDAMNEIMKLVILFPPLDFAAMNPFHIPSA